MSTNFANDGKLGVDVNNGGDVTIQDHALGTVARLGANKTAIYCYLGEAVTVTSGSAEPLALNAAFTASASAGGFTLTIPNASAGSPSVTFASGSYVWALTSAADVALA